MVNTISGLKNINLLTKEQYDGISNLASDELYAVETPTIVETYSDAAGNWYRIWSDGWVEQGGDVYVSNAGVWVNFLVQMADTYYYCGCKNITNNSYKANASMENPQTNGITVRSENSCNWRWMVAGQGE